MGAIVESRAITRLARLFGKSLRRRQKRHGLSEATLTMGCMLQSFFVAHHTIEAFRHVQQAKESAEKATQAATKAALELTKEWIPSLMKGTGKKTIEKMAGNAGRFAGRAAPFIGPVIDTFRGIYDYYQEPKNRRNICRRCKGKLGPWQIMSIKLLQICRQN